MDSDRSGLGESVDSGDSWRVAYLATHPSLRLLLPQSVPACLCDATRCNNLTHTTETWRAPRATCSFAPCLLHSPLTALSYVACSSVDRSSYSEVSGEKMIPLCPGKMSQGVVARKSSGSGWCLAFQIQLFLSNRNARQMKIVSSNLSKDVLGSLTVRDIIFSSLCSIFFSPHIFRATILITPHAGGGVFTPRAKRSNYRFT